MSDRNHLQLIGLESINYGVGKPANQRPPGAPIDLRMACRVVCYPFQNCLDLAEVFKPQTIPSLLVPLKPLRHVRFGFRADDMRMAHFGFDVMRSNTSCHGEPAPGLPWRACRRSSINRLSSSVNWRASGASAMLFQMSSTSCNRSGTGNCNNSDAEKLFIAQNIADARP
jgi:hypothetical protein